MSHWNGRHSEGYARVVRDVKKIEATQRAEKTPHERTKAHRLGKCLCAMED
jgi:hypothetical protein